MSRMRAIVWGMPCFFASMQATMFPSSLSVTAIRMSAPLMSGSFIVSGLEIFAVIVSTSSVVFAASSWLSSPSTTTTSMPASESRDAML